MTLSTAVPGMLDQDELGLLRDNFLSNPSYRLAQNAVTRVSIDDVAINREILNAADHTASKRLDDWSVTDQARSGRCWLFAGLNLLRAGVSKKLGVKDFEFSQNYMMFWDKLERANYLLEAMIATAERDIDDRTVAHLLDSVAEDGGQWDMFVALVGKHGLVPKPFMPETESSGNTGRMNSVLQVLLRQGAQQLREIARRDQDEARAAKAEVLKVVHRVLSIHLGSPPERFLWQWMDKDNGFHRDGELSPSEFAAEYVELPLDDYVCLVNDPRPSSPMGRTFTVEFLGNIVEAPPVLYLNVEIEVMKELAAGLLADDQPVWFGCDVKQMMSNEYGLWDAKLFDLPAVYDASFHMSKSDRLLMHESRMTHAMLFTGVDIVEGKPRRWRVENSWGSKRGNDGFYTMNDSWFDEYLFEVAVPRDRLAPELREALDAAPIVLPPWDPMGALARG
ncbi:MAG TPA: C1 family peptidase [Solirubrobacteraceae bacterium]|nr:C1 family peptidase [Solirubrobacteraceae bacterium]